MILDPHSFLGGPEIELHEGKYTTVGIIYSCSLSMHAGWEGWHSGNFDCKRWMTAKSSFMRLVSRYVKVQDDYINLHPIPHCLHAHCFFMHVRCRLWEVTVYIISVAFTWCVGFSRGSVSPDPSTPSHCFLSLTSDPDCGNFFSHNVI